MRVRDSAGHGPRALSATPPAFLPSDLPADLPATGAAAIPAQTVDLVVTPSGGVRAIYDERVELAGIGRISISRGSHVEPTSDGRWTADLSPCRGPLLGPFRRRSEALAAEVAWLTEHWLNRAT